MNAIIYDIIDRFGGRPAGSEKEKEAQLYYKSLLEKFCDKVIIQPFTMYPQAKFESLKLFFGLYYLSLILFFFDTKLALLVSVVDLVFFLGHFVFYYHWLDPLFPKATSHNVVGTIEPTDEVRRTIIFSGHMDTTKEFIWWYRFKHAGIVMTTISGFMLVFWPLYLGAFVAVGSIGALKWGWLFFAATSPMTLTMFFIHGKDFIQGAQDNLSGIAVGYSLGQYFAERDNRLKHTRIKIASFGTEELGLYGATAYAKAFKQELLAENAININLDGIKDRDKINIITSEIMLFVKYPEKLVNELKAAFEKEGIKYNPAPLSVGATDGAAMARQGIPAVAIVAQSLTQLDPTYHTRLDIPECVDVEALEDCKWVLVRFVKDSDAAL